MEPRADDPFRCCVQPNSLSSASCRLPALSITDTSHMNPQKQPEADIACVLPARWNKPHPAVDENMKQNHSNSNQGRYDRELSDISRFICSRTRNLCHRYPPSPPCPEFLSVSSPSLYCDPRKHQAEVHWWAASLFYRLMEGEMCQLINPPDFFNEKTH